MDYDFLDEAAISAHPLTSESSIDTCNEDVFVQESGQENPRGEEERGRGYSLRNSVGWISATWTEEAESWPSAPFGPFSGGISASSASAACGSTSGS